MIRMIKDFEELVTICDEELQHREYESRYYSRIIKEWDLLRKWMNDHNLTEFNEEIGIRYCDEIFGTHLMPKKPPTLFREKLRAIRMLISYQINGDFEFRCPRVEYIFSGDIGAAASEYLEYCKCELTLAKSTIENKRLYLYNFCNYITAKCLEIDDISAKYIQEFFNSMNYTLASRHNASRTISIFLKYVYEQGKSKKDLSNFILPDNYKKNNKLPTTYEEYEIRNLISSVERASAIGKRDYLILLLATEYGWRAKDITKFSFNNIDWDNNVISFNQHKTDTPVIYPLLSTVGNAIIDYLEHSRPETDVPEIIVSLENANKGKPLSSPTIHSIVTKYMKRANINNWQSKKHGPHAMRHSLATNMLKKNISLPIISTVLGHQRTETTSVYLSIDYEKLKQCALPMPILRSEIYRKEVQHGSL